MNCSDCGSRMAPLFTGYFCPNDCDKKTTTSGSSTIIWTWTPFKDSIQKSKHIWQVWLSKDEAIQNLSKQKSAYPDHTLYLIKGSSEDLEIDDPETIYGNFMVLEVTEI